MKRALTVVLLLMSLASVAVADGGGLPPTQPKKPPVVVLADGGGLPPVTMPPHPVVAV